MIDFEGVRRGGAFDLTFGDRTRQVLDRLPFAVVEEVGRWAERMFPNDDVIRGKMEFWESRNAWRCRVSVGILRVVFERGVMSAPARKLFPSGFKEVEQW